MDARIRVGFFVLAGVALSGCAIGTKLGWRAERVQASDAIRANCESNLGTLKGQPDYDTAMRACLDAKTRQHAD